MADLSQILVRLKLLGAAAAERDAKRAARGLAGLGPASRRGAAGNAVLSRTSDAATRSLRLMGRAARYGALAIGVGIAAEARVGIRELTEAQDVMAQTEARIRSTGGAANVTAQDVDRLSNRWQRVSGIQDDVIGTGANMLLTFRNLRNEAGKGNRIFDQSVGALLNMSVAMASKSGGEINVTSAAIRLGKALNDPIGGITSLKRVGVQFTDAEREKIKALVESGKTMDAQKLILRELSKEFGGSAKAAGSTFTGKLARLKRANEDVTETIVRGSLPALNALATTALTDVVPKLDVAADQIAAIWKRPGLTAEDRMAASWDAIAATGLPDQVKEAFYNGLAEVGTRAPGVFVKALQEAPWPAKGLIAALVLAKLGISPALLGRGIGRALGGVGAAGGAGKLAGVGRMAGVQKVFVVNKGFGGGAGPKGPGAIPVGGWRGLLAKGAGVAVPGIGAGVGAGAGAGLGVGALAGLAAAGIGGAIGIGLGVNAADKKWGLLGPSEAEARKAGEKATDAVIEAWRKGRPALRAEWQKTSLIPLGPIVERVAAAADGGVKAFQGRLQRGGPKVQGSARHLTTSALFALRGLAPGARKLAADSIVSLTLGLEQRGTAPRGATKRLVDAIEAQFGRLPGATRRFADQSAAGLAAFRTSLAGVQADVDKIVRTLDPATGMLTPATVNRIRQARNENATGGRTRGGITLVGERGPELIGVGRGARVLSHSQTREALRPRQWAGGHTGPLYANITINVGGKQIHREVQRVELRQEDRR